MRVSRLSALFLTTALALGAVAHVQAADIGECGTPEAMTAKMQAEGQRSIASAQRIQGTGANERMTGMVFTSNADRTSGYILHTDKPIGERATQICVYNRLANIRFSDARKSVTPEDVFLRASNQQAAQKCKELVDAGKISQGSCLPLNKAIRDVEHLGQRVMFQAFNTVKKPDGSYQPDGTLTTVMGNVNGTIGGQAQSSVNAVLGSVLYSSLPDGATVINATLLYPKYTEYGLVALERQMTEPKVAMR